ncbi:hypothetical protein CBF_2711 [Clostridium botulinum F str. 230613]|nr:hypothetical protein [Clostridium botulinum]ADG00348.1 hypothetical protein CBF_2711 [Clostridium botulinum F str. 230613]
MSEKNVETKGGSLKKNNNNSSCVSYSWSRSFWRIYAFCKE